MEEKFNENALKDMPIQAENLAFAPGEMILCAKCQRTNPPTRLACFYCGAELVIEAEQIKNLRPNLRKMEIWEKGFNLVLSPDGGTFDKARVAEIAKLLNMERDVLQKLFENHPVAGAPPMALGKEGNFGKALPLARAESEKEANIIRERLREFGVETFILSDEKLQIEKPPTRLRGLEFSGDKIILIFFNKDEIAEIANEDLCLIVTGAIFERKLEATEKHNKKGDNKILQTTETASDDFLIDIYSRKDAGGYRIFAKGFDFSCLEAEKEILAKDNLKKLAQKLFETAPDAKLVEDYLEIRESLANVWEVEERKDSRGLKREGFGRFNMENITTVNNQAQFTKYSRLQWHLLLEWRVKSEE